MPEQFGARFAWLFDTVGDHVSSELLIGVAELSGVFAVPRKIDPWPISFRVAGDKSGYIGHLVQPNE
jgi:hypothetical protein